MQIHDAQSTPEGSDDPPIAYKLPESITVSRRHYTIMAACAMHTLALISGDVKQAIELGSQIEKYTMPKEFKAIFESLANNKIDGNSLDLSVDAPQELIDRNAGRIAYDGD